MRRGLATGRSRATLILVATCAVLVGCGRTHGPGPSSSGPGADDAGAAGVSPSDGGASSGAAAGGAVGATGGSATAGIGAGADGTVGGEGGAAGSAGNGTICTGSRVISDTLAYDSFVAEGCGELTGSLELQVGDLSQPPGLETLIKVDGDLIIQGSPKLKSFEALAHLESVGGAVTLQNLPQAHGFAGLGVKNAASLAIQGPFTTLEGLQLTSLSGQLSISNTDIESLAGLSQLLRAGSVMLTANPHLTSLEGLNPNLVTSDFQLGASPVTSLAPLADLKLGGLTIDGLGSSTLGGLENLKELNNLAIKNNAELTSLAALSGLSAVGTRLTISNNAKLTDLAGLEGVTHVGENLWLDGNAALTNIQAVLAWPPNTIGQFISIHDNHQLEQCWVDLLDAQQNASCSNCVRNHAGGVCN